MVAGANYAHTMWPRGEETKLLYPSFIVSCPCSPSTTRITNALPGTLCLVFHDCGFGKGKQPFSDAKSRTPTHQISATNLRKGEGEILTESLASLQADLPTASRSLAI